MVLCAQVGGDARRLGVPTARAAFEEFRAMGGREVLFTGGEPFLHPELGQLVAAAEGFSRTILTNAMVFDRGRRVRVAAEDSLIRPVAEEGFARTGVHVSLDTVEPEPTIRR